MFGGFLDYPELIFVDETHLIPDDNVKKDEKKKRKKPISLHSRRL